LNTIRPDISPPRTRHLRRSVVERRGREGVECPYHLSSPAGGDGPDDLGYLPPSGLADRRHQGPARLGQVKG